MRDMWGGPLGVFRAAILLRYFASYPSWLLRITFLLCAGEQSYEWLPKSYMYNNTKTSPICSITSMITNRTGRNEVLLPITITKLIFVIYVFALLNIRKKHENSKSFLASSEKKPFKCMRAMASTVQLHRHDTFCHITLSYKCWNQDSW